MKLLRNFMYLCQSKVVENWFQKECAILDKYIQLLMVKRVCLVYSDWNHRWCPVMESLNAQVLALMENAKKLQIQRSISWKQILIALVPLSVRLQKTILSIIKIFKELAWHTNWHYQRLLHYHQLHWENLLRAVWRCLEKLALLELS